MAKKTVQYKGYEICASREDCMAGYELLYFSIYRISDGYECVASFEDSAETIDNKIQQLKERIDNEHKEDDPWMEKEDYSNQKLKPMNTPTLIHLIGEYYGIEVLEGAKGFKVERWISAPHLIIEMPLTPDLDPDYYIPLPPGNWQVIGLAKDCTEEDWKKIVRYIPYGNLDRWVDYEFKDSVCYKAKESGFSLLKSKGLSESNTLIIKKN